MAQDIVSTPAPLPSLSTLTGNVRPSTTAALIEQSFQSLKSFNVNRLASPYNGSSGNKPSAIEGQSQVGTLRDTAFRHLGSLGRSVTSPYHHHQRPSPDRLRLAQAVEERIQALNRTGPAPPPGGAAGDAAGLPLPPLAHAPSETTTTAAGAAPDSPYALNASQSALLAAMRTQSRPSTSLSIQDLTLPKPGNNRLSRSLNNGLSVSWAGPLVTGAQTPPPQYLLSPAGSKPGTPLHGRAAAGRGAGAPLAPPPLNDALMQGLMDGGSGGGGPSPLLQPRLGTPPRTPGGSIQHPHHRLATAPPGSFSHTATKAASASAPATPGSPLGRTPNAAGHFAVSRGMVYSVFEEMDAYASGKLTYSAFEDAGCRIGMRPDQARKLFGLLDPSGRGYTTIKEWGTPSLEKQITAFTRLYVQATRAENGRPRDVKEVKSIQAAIQMAMTKLQLKSSGRTISQDRLVEAFKFIDRDASGALDRVEIEDALNGLGIFVTPDVMDSVMVSFDKDGSGCVDYNEFLRTLFPTLGKAINLRAA